MNNLKMLEMALNALKQCTSNEWVESRTGERYNIEAALSKIKKSSRIETYSEQIQNEIATIEKDRDDISTPCPKCTDVISHIRAWGGQMFDE